jgi:hypothetical protein
MGVMLRGESRLQVVCVATLLHVLFAGFGHAFRYEAYLYASMLVCLAPSLMALLQQGFASQLSGALLLLVGSIGLGQRGIQALVDVPRASSDIYRQQLQMAAFVRRHYQGQTILCNDIGAISFFGETEVLDIAGLGTREMLALRDPREDRATAVQELVEQKQARIGIFYEAWLKEKPKEWVRVEQWTVPNPTVLGGPTVSFYALSEGEVESLRAALSQFRPLLPSSVEVSEDLPVHLHESP